MWPWIWSYWQCRTHRWFEQCKPILKLVQMSAGMTSFRIKDQCPDQSQDQGHKLPGHSQGQGKKLYPQGLFKDFYRLNTPCHIMSLYSVIIAQVFTVRCEAHARFSYRRLSVRLPVCPLNACIVTPRKHLAKKVQLWLIGSRLRAFSEPKMNIDDCL